MTKIVITLNKDSRLLDCWKLLSGLRRLKLVQKAEIVNEKYHVLEPMVRMREYTCENLNSLLQ